ncbi:MAG: hypothetical protein ACO3KZ_07735 [Ilumatobacteraceae bacterium]
MGISCTHLGVNNIRKGKLMSSHEADRLNLHQTLRGLMPEDVADILMAHLPPVGWSNVATKDDINLLRMEMNQRFTRVDERLKQVDPRFTTIDARFDQIDARLDQFASMKRYVVTTGISLVALILGMGVSVLVAVI